MLSKLLLLACFSLLALAEEDLQNTSEELDGVVKDAELEDEVDDSGVERQSPGNYDIYATKKDKWAIDNSIVHELNRYNFSATVQNHSSVMIEWYHTGCLECRSLEPVYRKVARILNRNKDVTVLARINGIAEPEIAKTFRIKSYPTFIYFKNEDEFGYDGERTAKAMVSFIRQRSGKSWEPPATKIVNLTDSNFTEYINQNEIVLVKFYEPWCGLSRQLAPRYEAAAQELATDDRPATLAQLDMTVEKQVCEEYNITTHPLLVLYRKGKHIDYTGLESEHGIIRFMRNETRDISDQFNNVEEMNNLLNQDDVTIVGFFSDDNNDVYRNYTRVSNDHRRDFSFIHTFEPSLATEHFAEPNTVAAYVGDRFACPQQSRWLYHQGESDYETLQEFIINASTPLVGEYNASTRHVRYGDKRPLVVFLYTVRWDIEHVKATSYWRHRIATVADRFADFTFAVADDEDNQELMGDCGLDTSGEDMNVCVIDENDSYYPMLPAMEEFEEEEVEYFLAKYKKGKINVFVKSQPIPKHNNAPVKIVVGKTFNKIVLDRSKDVLLQLLAPYCTRCEFQHKAYHTFAKKMKKHAKSLVVAEMDTFANHRPRGFPCEKPPCFYLVPASKTAKPIELQFKGNLTTLDLRLFVTEHSIASFRTKDEL